MEFSACELFIWFCLIGVVGWLWESAYCTVVEHRWQNRGFLFGPICPIYGVAALSIMGITHLIEGAVGHELDAWQVFVTAALTSAVVEYVTSLALERIFHARWWDYSDMPLNVNGRICLPATVLFGLAGIGCVFVFEGVLASVTGALGFVGSEVCALILCSIVSVDTGVTVSALTRFAEVATSVSDAVNEHMEHFVDGVFEQGDAAQTKIAAERERFAKALRASRVSQMGHAVRAAAQRMRMVGRTPTLPAPQGLKDLWQELVGK